jgi:hypothetical protein
MDTRSKILTPAAARALPGPLTAATGYFDVLRAADVRELAALKGAAPLLAVVLPRAKELLPLRARAELAAALSVVDYVVAAEDEDLDAFLHALPAARVARLEEAGEARVRQLIEHVRNRQNR